MKRLSSGTMALYTFKQGPLSSLAHDLKLSLEEFSVDQEGEDVVVTCPLDTLRVDGVVDGDSVDTSRPSAADRKRILAAVHDEILDSSRYPTAVYRAKARAEGSGYALEGFLTLRGVTQLVDFSARRQGSFLCGEVELAPSRFGIEPYRALLGAIKLSDRVRIEFRQPDS
jgi:polyisoprenoid-binding protein YceI